MARSCDVCKEMTDGAVSLQPLRTAQLDDTAHDMLALIKIIQLDSAAVPSNTWNSDGPHHCRNTIINEI
jgi:hypothetical protein